MTEKFSQLGEHPDVVIGHHDDARRCWWAGWSAS